MVQEKPLLVALCCKPQGRTPLKAVASLSLSPLFESNSAFEEGEPEV
jgi:hypothetical protein